MFLLVEMVLFHGIARKAFQAPKRGDCGMVRLILSGSRRLSLSFQCPVSICPMMREKAQPCLHQTQNKDQCPEILCLFSPLEPTWSVLDPRGLLYPCGCYRKITQGQMGLRSVTKWGKKRTLSLLGSAYIGLRMGQALLKLTN